MSAPMGEGFWPRVLRQAEEPAGLFKRALYNTLGEE